MKNRNSGALMFISFFLFFLCNICGHAQVNNVGKVMSWHREKGGVKGKAERANFEVIAFSPNIIRVRVSKNATFRNFSYTLEMDSIHPFAEVKVTESKNLITLNTPAIIAEITTSPALAVTFKNLAGAIINQDVQGNGFGTTFIGDKVSIYKKLQEGERFVGLGEVLGNLDKRGMGFALNNTDTYKYGDARLPMYGSFPFYIGLHHQQVYGLFFNNTYKTYFNFGQSTPNFASVNMDGGDLDYFYFYDHSIAGLLKHYSTITGKMPLPPLWSLGYHQSRCSYYPEYKVMDVARSLRARKFPADCIVIDADYLKEYEPFRINTDRFPDMKGMVKKLKEMNFEVTASVNPGIKIDSTYEAHADGLKNDVYVKFSDGSNYVADIAPSTNHYVDFTNPQSRNWWIDHMKFLPDNGIHGYWNDMNEPAVGGSYLPDNLLFDFDGHKANALEAKNVYGMQMARSSYLSGLKYGEGRRPFILTRSGFSGVQRYSAMWSGDNTNSDEGLLTSVLLNSQLGLSGMPFCGFDVGGFIGDGNRNLFARWMEVGAFSPFCRNHRGFFFQANEPWAYGEEVEAIAKSYIGFRYRLMPYLYGAFHEASVTGMPVARSLCIEHPFDASVYDNNFQYQFLFGDAILVAPVTTQETTKKVYLPKGDWYNLYTDQLYHGDSILVKDFPLHQLPLYVKASALIPTQRDVQSTRENSGDTLQFHVYKGLQQNAYDYYEDAGDGFAYRQNHEFYSRRIDFIPAERKLQFNPVTGNYPTHFKFIKIIFHGFDHHVVDVKSNNNLLATGTQLDKESKALFDPLEGLADYYDAGYFSSLRAAENKVVSQSIVLPFNDNNFSLSW